MRGSSSTMTFLVCSFLPTVILTVYSPGSTRGAACPPKPPPPPPPPCPACPAGCSPGSASPPETAASVVAVSPPGTLPAVVAAAREGGAVTDRVREFHTTRLL